jgi:hypothetical protein
MTLPFGPMQHSFQRLSDRRLSLKKHGTANQMPWPGLFETGAEYRIVARPVCVLGDSFQVSYLGALTKHECEVGIRAVRDRRFSSLACALVKELTTCLE